MEDAPLCFISETAGAHWVDCVSYLKAKRAVSDNSLERLFGASAIPQPFESAAKPEETPEVALPSELLADKWRPRQYTQLLSDETCNLEIMGYFESFSRGAPDRDALPWVLVLNGPPGVGKSTLCGVIARHWGFHPVEVNASRERNESQFIQAVTGVFKSAGASETFGEGPSKNCLIVEELDGISPHGVAALSREVFSANRASPVVCVTNDLYVAQLRALRQHPRVRCLTIPPIDEGRMLQRLTAIAQSEGIYPGMAAERLRAVLKHVASHANGDIRVALNLLQMAHVPRGALSEARPSADLSGKSPFGIWAFLLTKRRPLLQQAERDRVPVQRLLDELQRVPHVSRIADGVFANFLGSLGMGTFHYANGRSLVRCARLWSAVDSATARFGPAGLAMQRIWVVAVHIAVQREGTYTGGREYRWPRGDAANSLRETARGHSVAAFVHNYARVFSRVLTARDAVLSLIPAIIATALPIDGLLNETVGYDYTRLPQDGQDRVEHISGILRRYGLLPAPTRGGGARRSELCAVFTGELWDAMADIAEYCVVEKRGVFEFSPGEQRPVEEEVNLMSLRSIMRDAPKLPISKAAAAADKRRFNPFAKFLAPRGEGVRVRSEVQPKWTKAMPEYIVRYRPYKFSTSRVVRQAVMGDFML